MKKLNDYGYLRATEIVFFPRIFGGKAKIVVFHGSFALREYKPSRRNLRRLEGLSYLDTWKIRVMIDEAKGRVMSVTYSLR